MNIKTKRDILIIIFVSLFYSAVLYGYYMFFHPAKLQYVYQNWDGPAYLVIAKSFYNSELITQNNTVTLPNSYFAAHFPLYPFFIKIFSFIGEWRSMIFVSQLFSILFIIGSYFLGKIIAPKINPLIPALTLTLFPPRWFIISHVGSSEPVYLFFITLAIIFLLKNKNVFSALFVGVAQLVRAQTILFVAGLGLYYLFRFATKKINLKQLFSKIAPFFIAPMVLVLIFSFYQIQFGNFFAFFDAIKSFQHLQLPPYKVFYNYRHMWSDMVMVNLIFYTFATLNLFTQGRKKLGFIALAFLLPLNFLVHLDTSRYALAILPLAYISFYKLFANKKFLLVVFLLSPALIFYSINLMNINLSP